MFYKQNLFEYDIRKCNINVCVTFNLISEELYNKLNNMEKQKREVEFGLFLKENKDIYPKFKQAVSRCVERFKKINDLSDKDINEVANDAVWTYRRVLKTSLNERIEFVCKRECTSMFQYRKIKFYYNSNTGELFQRGLGNKEFKFFDFISEALQKAESGNPKTIYKFLHNFKLDYVKRNLDKEHYEPLIDGQDNLVFIDTLIEDLI